MRLSGQARSEAEGGPTASKIEHFVEGNATCWSDACENAGERQFGVRRLISKSRYVTAEMQKQQHLKCCVSKQVSKLEMTFGAMRCSLLGDSDNIVN